MLRADTNHDVLLIDKPAGMSSFGVVARVRRQLSEQVGKKVKVGHAGTLDPFATGLLILLVGKACKEAGAFLKLDKSYQVTAILGKKSSTGDPEGEVTEVNGSKPTKEQVIEVLRSFVGTITQTPPIYSAIKVNGQRAYNLARKGKEVKIEPREVTIHSIELVQYEYPRIEFVCSVSSGTYIRSLVEDIGEKLGTGAYTSELRRLKIADYDVQNVVDVQLD